MNKRKDDLKITLTIKYLNDCEAKVSLETNKRKIKDTSFCEQLYIDVISHVFKVVSKQDINDKYFDLEKFIKDDEKLTIKCIIDELKED